MGFFDFFKKKKSEYLSLPEKFTASFIQSMTEGRSLIKLGQKIKVPEQKWAVIVVKDRPCDVFNAGEWQIILDSIPLTTKALRLNKPVKVVKKGKTEKVYKTEFKCDLYFVNAAVIANMPWEMDTISMRQKDKSKYSVSLGGVADFRCTDPVAAIKLFLYDWAKIESQKAERRVCEYIGEFASEYLYNSRDITPQQIDDRENFADVLRMEINKKFARFGLEVTAIQLVKCDFDIETAARLAQERIERNIASDEINEMGAEISVLDARAEKPSGRGAKKASDSAGQEKIAVLDMTEDSGSVAEPADVAALKTAIKAASDETLDTAPVSDKAGETPSDASLEAKEELPNITLNKKNIDNE